MYETLSEVPPEPKSWSRYCVIYIVLILDMIIICDNYIDGIFKTANFKFLNLNYIIRYSHPRVTFPPCIQSPEKSLLLHNRLFHSHYCSNSFPGNAYSCTVPIFHVSHFLEPEQNLTIIFTLSSDPLSANTVHEVVLIYI